MANSLTGQIFRFIAVGGVGFVIDGGMLFWLTANGIDAYIARAISFPMAVVATWWLNRKWTFRAANAASRNGQFRRYFGVQVIGSLTNYTIYAIVITLFGRAQPTILAGFVLGSALGSAFNFAGARYYAFRAHLKDGEGQ